MNEYLLGLATLPAIILIAWLLLNLTGWFYYRALASCGITIEIKRGRNIERVLNSYVLRHDIWFERQCGPIFTGHWCRNEGTEVVATRWLGVGNSGGRCAMVLRKRTVISEVRS